MFGVFFVPGESGRFSHPFLKIDEIDVNLTIELSDRTLFVAVQAGFPEIFITLLFLREQLYNFSLCPKSINHFMFLS
jgi:hypothetical protein